MIEPLMIKDLKTVEFSIDTVCKLFFYENRVLRAINKPYEGQVKEMFSSGMMRELIEKELFIDSWISETKIEGYNLVVEHQYIQFWNYPYEWSFNMLKDSANVVLEVNEIANKYNFELFDVHAYNVVFDMSKPKYIDFGSFFIIDKRNNNCWTGYLNFYNSFYIPLYLYTKGYSDLSQNIYLFNGFYNDKDFFILRYKYLGLFGSTVFNLFYKLHHNSRRLAVARYFRIIEKYGKHKYINYILKFKKFYQNKFSLKRSVKLIKQLKESKLNSYWKDYHNNLIPEKDKRFLRIANLINTELKDANILTELASNQGKVANFILEKTHLSKIIATDYDKNAVDKIYLYNKNNDNILPLVYDFVRPNGRRVDADIENRVKSDIVMALAVTHHLILSQDVGILHIFKTLKALTNKYIIVEFMPLGLYSGNMENIPLVPDFYKLDWFKKEFTNYFEYILDEEIDINRHLFIGKIKS